MTLAKEIGAARLPQATAQVNSYLQTIVETLKSLTQSDPAVAQILLALQVGQEGRTAQSLVARMMLLNRLVEDLIYVDPAAARRLASALPVLDKLLFDLIVTAENRTAITVAGHATMVSPLGDVASGAPWAAHRLFQLPGADGALAAPSTAVASPGNSAHSPSAAAVRIVGGRSAIKRPAAATSGSVAVPPALPPPLPGGGAVGVSGGVSLGVGASTVLIALLTVSLVYALLRERVVLTLVPWRSTLLATRLERPG